MRSIRAITLDLDDTLWDIEPVILRAEEKLWSWLQENYPRIGSRWSSERLVELRNSIAEEFPNQTHDFRFLRKRTLAAVAVDAGYSEDLVEPAFSVFDAARNDVELYADVEDVLNWLTTRFRVVAVTNGNANLEMIGIDHHFHGIVTSVGVGHAKPAPEIFVEAVRQCGVAADDILHVGDHPLTDVTGARNAGMRTAWMNRRQDDWPQEHPQPDVTIASMSELQNLLEGAGD